MIGSHSFRSTGSTSSWMSSESNYAGGHPGSVMSEGSQASFVVEVIIIIEIVFIFPFLLPCLQHMSDSSVPDNIVGLGLDP